MGISLRRIIKSEFIYLFSLYSKMSETDSMQIYLNSRYADEIADPLTGKNSDYKFIFPYISCPTNYYINVSLVNASIPFSFYQIIVL